jgi:alanine racemase
MDLILVDLGPDASDKPGDAVVLLGSDGSAEVKMQEFCDLLDTIPYEVACMVSKRVPRVYSGE